MQYPVHVQLAIRISDYTETPPVNLMYFGNRDIDPPTSTIPATDFNHLADSLPMTTISADYHNDVNIYQQLLTSVLVKSTNILSYLLYCYLTFVSFIVLLAVITRMLNTKTNCGVDVLIGSSTPFFSTKLLSCSFSFVISHATVSLIFPYTVDIDFVLFLTGKILTK